MLYHNFKMQLLQTRVDTYSRGQVVMSAPIFSNCSFYKKQKRTYSGGQVVISAPVSWEGGGVGSTGRDNAFHHHFQINAASANKSGHMGAGSNLCSCWLGMGWGGGGDSTGQYNAL